MYRHMATKTSMQIPMVTIMLRGTSKRAFHFAFHTTCNQPILSFYPIVFSSNNKINYEVYKQKAFAPNSNINNIMQIQSLENFFKNESLLYSKSRKLRNLIKNHDNKGRNVENYEVLKATEVIDLPSSMSQSKRKKKWSYTKPQTPMAMVNFI